MNERKTFKLKEIADKNGFRHRDVTHLHQMGAVSNLVHPGFYGEIQSNDQQKWTRLQPEEAIALSFTATFYQNLRIVEPSIIAAQRAIEALPQMFFEPDTGIRALPALLLFDQYPTERKSGQCIEFFNTEKTVAEIPEHFSDVEIRIGARFFHLLNESKPITTGRAFSFYPLTDLFFQFLKNLKIEISNLDPSIIWDMATPGKNYPKRSKLDFQREFYRFAIQDLDKVLKYLYI